MIYHASSTAQVHSLCKDKIMIQQHVVKKSLQIHTWAKSGEHGEAEEGHGSNHSVNQHFRKVVHFNSLNLTVANS